MEDLVQAAVIRKSPETQPEGAFCGLLRSVIR
jgi:hypothetical protein